MKPAPAIIETTVRRVGAGSRVTDADVLAIEEPLEIRLGFADGKHKAISITMRTPGDDAELAAGFLYTEGIVRSPEQVDGIKHCGIRSRRKAANGSNTIRVELNDTVEVDLKRLVRHFYMSSSCGVCGKSSIEALRAADLVPPASDISVTSAVIDRLPAQLRDVQAVFHDTGGLHASALFGTDGELDIVREDVGRHNALDKVIGRKFLDGELPLSQRVLLVSGRASFELVQKALMAGIPVMASVGAPSSLAVELANEYGMTLIGFLRDGRFNIYAGEERIDLR